MLPLFLWLIENAYVLIDLKLRIVETSSFSSNTKEAQLGYLEHGKSFG